MLHGLNQFLQEDEVTHAVSPYMTFHLYLSDQYGVEFRIFCEEEDIFRDFPFSKYRRLSPPSSTPQQAHSRIFLS